MELKFDHIIHHVHNLNEADIDFLKVINGGKHEQLGTYNKLSYTDLSYIEFIDAYDRTLVHKAAQSAEERLSFAASLKRTEYVEGFKRLCFRTDDINALKKHFNQLGVNTLGPSHMQRVTPEGQIIEWQLLYIDEDRNYELPFFIQWGATESEPMQTLSPYFQGNLEIEGIDIETTDFNDMAEVYVEWLGYEVTSGVINSYFKLEKLGCPAIYLIPGNTDSIKRLKIKSDAPAVHHFRNAIYQFN
ncbi:VOC family protein [Macrococcoides canis]|uniref:VOC family protein n=1 Tax=Macrococcoides canis TaxID=1855823 RepID=UPI0013E9366C|nr:VOC family protein [Macrococcus canis]QIH74934.1 VOC family protein [Macrococcus canis]